MLQDLVKIARTKYGIVTLLLLLAIIVGLILYKILPNNKDSQHNLQSCSPTVSNSSAQNSIVINNNCSDFTNKKPQ